MSDIKLWNKAKQSLVAPLPVVGMQALVEEAAKDVLGLRIIAKNYSIDANTNEMIPTLALDESNTLVVIEYRQGKFSKVVDKAFVYIDYIKQNISKVRMLLRANFSEEDIRSVSFEPRLIIIGDDFNRYDDYAIKQLPMQIDLIKCQVMDQSLVLFEKNFHSKSVDHTRFRYTFRDAVVQSLYQQIKDFVLSLGDEVVETGIGDVLCYRKIKHIV